MRYKDTYSILSSIKVGQALVDELWSCKTEAKSNKVERAYMSKK